MKPVIGITPLYDEEKKSIWMLPGYMEAIRNAGGVPVILPLYHSEEGLDTAYSLCHGFLFTGGQDINPVRYGEARSEACGICNEEKDDLETKIFRRAYKEDKPILGICRGLQLINVELGGSLYQDLPSQYQNPGTSCLEHCRKPSENRIAHKVRIEYASALYQLLSTEEIEVNSYHHQGIKSLGRDLEIMAAASDGLIEAIRCESRSFIWGIQWHPEFLYMSDAFSRSIFMAFMEAVFKKV